MLRQTLPCHERCEQLRIMQLMHITLVVKLMDEIIHLNGANHPHILTRPFGSSIHVIHAPQKGCGNQTWC
jgi:hypothetical protein